MDSDVSLEPSVSVLLNVWAGDDCQAVVRSVQSVTAQTLLPNELIIVVDGPIQPDIRNYLAYLPMSVPFPVVVYQLEDNHGLWFARNVGLRLSNSDLVALQDADDVMHPDRLSVQRQWLLRHGASVVGSIAVEFENASNRIICFRRTPLRSELRLQDFLIRNGFHHSSVMFLKPDITAIGGYRNLPGVEDIDLWRRLLSTQARLVNIPMALQALGTDLALLRRRRFSKAIFHVEIQLATHLLSLLPGYRKVLVPLSCAIRVGYRLLPLKAMALAQKLFLRSTDVMLPNDMDEFLSERPMDRSTTLRIDK
jgi:glycosyltransferase involved in cell wall biosynthesis